MDGQPRGIGAPVLVLLGPPGAGKRTQARLLEERFGLLRLSMADMRPARAAAETADGCAVADETLLANLADRLDRSDTARGLVLAGFPRTPAQAEALDNLLAARGLKIGAAVSLTVDESAAAERIPDRHICKTCGEGGRDPRTGTCDTCGGNLTCGPEDDAGHDPARLDAYHTRTAPLIEYFARRGVLLRIDAMRAVDEVTLSLGGVVRALED